MAPTDPSLTPPAEPPELTDLADTLEEIRKLLRKIAYDWSELLVAHDRRKYVQDAYDEVTAAGGAFERVKKELSTPPTPELEQKLRDAGLEASTRQLELKLSKGRSLWGAFHWFGGRRKLGRLLAWINTFLESLGAAIPGAEAIKELKDACEEELKDTED